MGRLPRVWRGRDFAIRAGNDFGAILVAFALAYLVFPPPAPLGAWSPSSELMIVWASFGICVVVVFRHLGLYRPGATVLLLRELQLAVAGIALAAVVVLSALFVLRVDDLPRLAVMAGIGLSFITVITARRLSAAVSRTFGRLGTEHRTLIYGCGETGRLLMKKIAQSPQMGRQVVGFVDDYAAIGSSVTCRISQHDRAEYSASVVGRGHEIARLVSLHDVTELLITSSAADSSNLRRIVPLARDSGVQIGIVPRLGDIRADELQAEDLGAVSVLRPHVASAGQRYLFVKRFVDLVVSVVCLVVLVPFWLLTVVLIRLDSPGPALFKQERIGENGRRFVMYKFRTMKVDSPTYASSTLPHRPRVTGVGRILRVTSFDEVPQMLNIIKGDMSLVGPRPEMPFLVAKYSSLERKRLNAKPGLTGVWQLSPDRHGAEIHENVEYDLFYIRHRSMLLDTVILIETVLFSLAVVPIRLYRLWGKTRSSSATREQTRQAGTVSGERVLLALDQRRKGSGLQGLSMGLSAARERAGGATIQVLAAPMNVKKYDALVKETASDAENGNNSIVEYVPYERQAQLRALTRSARVVVTDLPHVAEWAREKGIETVDVGQS